MALTTTQGKEAALGALQKRRLENKDRKRIDNGSLYAGSPMHFDCSGCGADISVPEDYTTRPEFCPECEGLKELGWLE
ncbi:MAG: hypothetical protein A3B23_03740 [Candidatus Colwellbacteria bacterium RIFCSPLOWO2_01_FULL_48_10]|uniref:Uncharacterized protein n=2 Tax=Bacteria candidate phyla TaxID=1783234 RepID=A0A1F5P3Y1_9BACT|nr:MAG: hypothetical protein A2846_02810 [Candidatus Doudnabacteria bacterium RIFCSPHIGHO2_01_FULL_49_9]OGY59374.1 MAG: hypothetical protein A3B23_03740 [Candidatus Colwellbacteria bacterium RIFCSPLOWO2_01_FULL_48_10]